MRQHDVEWTPEKIGAFWDYITHNPALSGMYFTKENGRGVVQDIVRHINLNDKDVLDFGCGPGHLFKPLSLYAPAIRYHGLDFSAASIAQLRERHGKAPQFQDAWALSAFPVPVDKKFDVIICCEVVEHLDQKTLEAVAAEFSRLLKPGGLLYVTTPHEENLEESKIMCPECGGVFHRWQHVRSWSGPTLSGFLGTFGFDCRETHVLNYGPNIHMTRLKTAAKRLLGRKLKNMNYIGVKRGAGPS